MEDDFLNTSQSIVDIFPDGANPADMHPPRGLDYRSAMPSSEEDMEDIQAALSTTKVQYLEEIGRPCPPTTRHRCYFSQLDEVLDNQFTHWVSLGISASMPNLVTPRRLLRDSFKIWAASNDWAEAYEDTTAEASIVTGNAMML